LARLAPAATRVRAVADPTLFAGLLQGGRPRIAIRCSPPAGDRAIELVARERRHRSGLRTIHLSAPAEATARLAALRQGYDDALPQTIDPAELAGRAIWLEEQARARSAMNVE